MFIALLREDENSMVYYNTLILISDDCPAQESRVPISNRNKKTLAEIEYQLLNENPGFYTHDELQFEAYMNHREIPETNREEERKRFFAKKRACMRTSALPKRYGWGIYFDAQGKAELVPVESDRYQMLENSDTIKKVKAMRSKR